MKIKGDLKIKRLRTNRYGEFNSHEFNEFFEHMELRGTSLSQEHLSKMVWLIGRTKQFRIWQDLLFLNLSCEIFLGEK